ncbi:MAG TPA: tail fiber domain-containing protein [Dissulfurispiraceae bacterium]|nr:tail fiber domain-containing protein [Dissulfurispiraceae bacterium]
MTRTFRITIAIVAMMLSVSATVWAAPHESDYNTWIGYGCGQANPATDARDTFFGYNAGYYNDDYNDSSGVYNSFFGFKAGYNTGSQAYGVDNSFFGANAGLANTKGMYNSIFGAGAGYSLQTDNDNTFFGRRAGYSTKGYNASETASGNVFIGYYAGHDNTTGAYNVFLGPNAGYSNTTGSYKLFIDDCFAGSACDSPLIYGDFENRTVQINGKLAATSYSALSDIRLKKNIAPLETSIDKVMKLSGVSFEWRSDENPGRGFEHGRMIGLIAQDVETVVPEVVSTQRDGYKTLSYDRLIPVLIEAIKEQRKLVDRQEADMAEMKYRANRQKLEILRQNQELYQSRLAIDSRKEELDRQVKAIAELESKIERLGAEIAKLKSGHMSAGLLSAH